jgi:HSP20 family molecular chaperone IbpA
MAKSKATQARSERETSGREKRQDQQAGAATQQQTGSARSGALQGSQSGGHEVKVGQGEGQSRASGEEGRRSLSRMSRDPFAMMQRMSEEMDQLFDSFFYGRPLGRRQSQLQSLWAPEVEVCEEGNQLRVCVDLPGVAKENVKIDVTEGILTIQGERREERTEGGERQGFRRSERRYGSFYRSIPLPDGADAEQAQARMKEGVLEITIPTTPPKQAKRLEIK